MSIVIDERKCKGCRMCASVCPGSLIKMSEGNKAYIKYPRDCWGCSSCIKECKTGAISLFLGADIGGMGSRMTVSEKDDKLYWNIFRGNGTMEQVVIDRKESNRY